MCYIKRQTISEGAQYKKAMAKFAAFLMDWECSKPKVVPAVLAQEILYMNSVGVYITHTTILLSCISTPILIIVFLKPVQTNIETI